MTGSTASTLADDPAFGSAHGRRSRAPHGHRGGSLPGIVCCLVLLALLSACGGGSKPASATKAHADAGQFGLKNNGQCVKLRAEHKSLVGKTVTVATSAGVPGLIEADTSNPGQFKGTVPDLVRSVGECLGFTPKMTALSFDGVIPAVTTGRFDMAAASMYDTPERRQQLTYVDYDAVAEYAVVPKGNPRHLSSLDDTCGLSTSAATGSKEIDYLTAQSDKCESESKKPLTILRFPDTAGAFQVLASGRVDFVLNGASANEGFLKDHSDFERALKPFRGPAEGMQFPKQSTDLINAVAGALKIAQAEGVQQQIIDKNGLNGKNLIVPATIGR